MSSKHLWGDLSIQGTSEFRQTSCRQPHANIPTWPFARIFFSSAEDFFRLQNKGKKGKKKEEKEESMSICTLWRGATTCPLPKEHLVANWNICLGLQVWKLRSDVIGIKCIKHIHTHFVSFIVSLKYWRWQMNFLGEVNGFPRKPKGTWEGRTVQRSPCRTTELGRILEVF